MPAGESADESENPQTLPPDSTLSPGPGGLTSDRGTHSGPNTVYGKNHRSQNGGGFRGGD